MKKDVLFTTNRRIVIGVQGVLNRVDPEGMAPELRYGTSHDGSVDDVKLAVQAVVISREVGGKHWNSKADARVLKLLSTSGPLAVPEAQELRQVLQSRVKTFPET